MTNRFSLIAALALLISAAPSYAETGTDDGGFGADRFANAAPAALDGDDGAPSADASMAVIDSSPTDNDAALAKAAAELNAVEAASGDEPSIIVDQVNPIAE